MRGLLLLLAGCLLAAAQAHAQTETQTTFEGCTDRRGQPVASRLDGQWPAVVGSAIEDGRPVIHYNPGQLPGLAPPARLFLFADECARHGLGLPATGPLTEAQAGAADCAAVEMLVRSGLVPDEAGVAAIQSALGEVDGEWARLPGPPRPFQLVACYRAWRERPRLGPAATRPAANACIHACGDRLWHCQQGRLSDAGGCLETYRACAALCD